MRQTVTIDLVKTIINHYPIVPSYLIHKAGREYCLSGSQRLRDLKKKGVMYEYQDHRYDFSLTPPLILQEILKEISK